MFLGPKGAKYGAIFAVKVQFDLRAGAIGHFLVTVQNLNKWALAQRSGYKATTELLLSHGAGVCWSAVAHIRV